MAQATDESITNITRPADPTGAARSRPYRRRKRATSRATPLRRPPSRQCTGPTFAPTSATEANQLRSSMLMMYGQLQPLRDPQAARGFLLGALNPARQMKRPYSRLPIARQPLNLAHGEPMQNCDRRSGT